MRCKICQLELNRHDDPLSIDCGGDCWGCVCSIEATMGDEYALAKVREEHMRGLRPDWTDPSTNG
ncbi:MAG: hypothetical protein EOO29_07925 [Comamonadaceae bacterium]|nr:MAG: hypothetical protein EOO29_07925 [Comamonadaceae bacterium]